jgi:hypothetical protein
MVGLGEFMGCLDGRGLCLFWFLCFTFTSLQDAAANSAADENRHSHQKKTTISDYSMGVELWREPWIAGTGYGL